MVKTWTSGRFLFANNSPLPTPVLTDRLISNEIGGGLLFMKKVKNIKMKDIEVLYSDATGNTRWITD